MRKIFCSITLITLLTLPFFVFTGCGNSPAPSGLQGEWKCDKLASDNETATFFYALRIDGAEFSIYDFEAGNPGISGTITSSEADTISISFNTEDFDPPFCWELDDEDELEYELVDDDTLRIGHNDIWLTFHRNDE